MGLCLCRSTQTVVQKNSGTGRYCIEYKLLQNRMLQTDNVLNMASITKYSGTGR